MLFAVQARLRLVLDMTVMGLFGDLIDRHSGGYPGTIASMRYSDGKVSGTDLTPPKE